MMLALALVLSTVAAYQPRVPDVEVVTQDGRRVHFYSDLVQGRTVAINFVFTNCSTICPVSGALFADLQKRSDRGVHLISVSIDPETDTPRKLAAWSRRFRSDDGGGDWTLVTGDRPSIDRLLAALGAPPGRPQDHAPLTIIGNDATHSWKRFYGMPGAKQLDAMFEEVR